MIGVQRVVTFVAMGVVALAIVFSLLPFTFAKAVSCGPALFGSKAGTTEAVGYITRPERACEQTGRSRLVTVGFVSILAVTAAAGVTRVPPPGKDCQDGRHGDCHGGWPALIGLDRFACQCSCH
ncbi:MAG: hypothetical protein ACR2G7_01030 [Acidimicrobiales bacterium]